MISIAVGLLWIAEAQVERSNHGDSRITSGGPGDSVDGERCLSGGSIKRVGAIVAGLVNSTVEYGR